MLQLIVFPVLFRVKAIIEHCHYLIVLTIIFTLNSYLNFLKIDTELLIQHYVQPSILLITLPLLPTPPPLFKKMGFLYQNLKAVDLVELDRNL